MRIIEGTDDQGDYRPDAYNPPFAVFDPDRQDWTFAGLRWRWLAWLLRWVK